MPIVPTGPASAPDEPGAPARGGTLVVVVLAFAGVVVALMQTVIIPLVPQLPALLQATPSDTTWAITATLLASAVATPTVGRLGDMYGKRRMLLVSLGMLVLGSVVAAVSTTLPPMIVGRALQGLSAGVIPLGISIMRDELAADRLHSGTALMSASLGVGGALGLPLAAFVAERADWHVLFWAAAAIGVLAAVLVVAVVPESHVRSGGRFDVVGAIGLSAGLLCLLLPVSKGGAWGWTSGPVLGLIAATVVIFAAWGWWELRTRQPLVNLRTLARRQLLLTNLASIVFGFAIFAMSLVLPQVLQLPTATGYGLGQSLLVVGLVLAPSGLVMMAMAPVSARITRTAGPKTTLMVGAVVVALGYGSGVFLLSTIWELVLVSALIGAGVGLAYGSMPALVMAAAPVSETASANSVNTLMRAVGTAVSSAVAGLILTEMTVPFGAGAVASLDAFRLVMGIAAGTALAALAVAAFLPAGRPPAAAPARGVRPHAAPVPAAGS